ncbi:hypothetical protein BKA66DRAFT_454347 [Pyrenochaeta sp. MPI-SDFR-AT-0127]|nr:hypothetical protein BKA66DRAFT_454347 [Pyrenochaeta sp. MPI-SDFR-AT-0127]
MASVLSCLLLLAAILSVAFADFVEPYPRHDCSTGITAGYTTCPNSPGCCFGASVCCAGGCCPTLSMCVNIGLPNEGCCPYSDTTNCGAPVPSFSKPACSAVGALNPKPSVQCVSADDDWYCPPGSVCGTIKPLCHDFFDLGCTSEAASPVPTTGPSPSSGTVGGGSGTGGSVTGSLTNAAAASSTGAAAHVGRTGSGFGVFAWLGLGMLL